MGLSASAWNTSSCRANPPADRPTCNLQVDFWLEVPFGGGLEALFGAFFVPESRHVREGKIHQTIYLHFYKSCNNSPPSSESTRPRQAELLTIFGPLSCKGAGFRVANPGFPCGASSRSGGLQLLPEKILASLMWNRYHIRNVRTISHSIPLLRGGSRWITQKPQKRSSPQ